MIFGVDFFKLCDGNAGIYLGGFQRLMAQHLLYVSHRGTVFKHVGGTGVAKRMGCYVLF